MTKLAVTNIRNYVALILSLCLLLGCSALRVHEYSPLQHYVILNTDMCKIYIPFDSLSKNFNDPHDDIGTAIHIIKGSKENIEITPSRINSASELFVLEFLDMQMEKMFKNKIPLILNKATNEWQNYKVKYISTPYGGKTLEVVNLQGNVLYFLPLSIG